MRKIPKSKTSHFTAFRSAREEVNERRAMNDWLDKGQALIRHGDQVVANSKGENACEAPARDAGANEGGHMYAKSGHVVQTSPGSFKVVLKHEVGDDTEQACATVREGEAIIRRNTPTPPTRSHLLDRDERSR